MINCIVAIEKSQGIGYNNSMPWPFLKEDMQWFKKMTLNNIIIMGSNTWKSLPFRPLKDRINVVLSNTSDYSHQGADYTFSNPDTALTFCQAEYPDKDIFIIGGSAIYDLCLNYVQKFYVTEIDENYECDRFFNFSFVQKNFTNSKVIATFNDPINFTIKEYTK